MKKLFKSYAFNISLMILVTVVALYFVLRDDFDIVMETLQKLNIYWVIGLAAFIFCYQLIIGLILTLLTRLSNPNYKYGQGLINALIAAFFHGVTPSASGGQVAQIYVYKKQKVAVSDAASILWMDFIIYQGTMVLTVFLLLLFNLSTFYNHHKELFGLVILGFIVNSIIIVGFWVITRFSKVYTWISTKGIELGHKLKLIKDKEKTLNNLNEGIKRFESETVKFKQHKKLIIKIILINIVRLVVYYSFPFICALALRIPISINSLLEVMTLTACVSMINTFVPIPGASGGTEVTFVLMFATIIGSANATSMMLVWRFFSYYFIMIIGAIVFILFKRYYARKEGENLE